MEEDPLIMSPRCRIEPCVLAFAIRLPLALLTIAIWNHPADGRVARTECAGFDGDVPLAAEALNDAASYAWVREWDQQWDQQSDEQLDQKADRDSGSAAARISAGSLDARKFLYHEEIRLQAAPKNSALWIFLQRKKRETVNEYKISNELNLTIPGPFFSGSLMTDSDSDKKWSDLGLALGRRKSLTDFAEGFIWSVDHYYNVKETSPARWSRRPLSWGFRLGSPIPDAAITKAEIEIDEPATYEVDGSTCHYRSRVAHLRGYYPAGFPLTGFSMAGFSMATLRWSIDHFQKRKSIDDRYAERNADSLDLSWGRVLIEQHTDTLGVRFHRDQLDRDSSAKSAFRNETILYGGRSQIISGNFWMFLGGVGSLGTQRIGEKLDYIEQLKFQTGLEYRIMDRSRDWDAANQMNQRQGAGRLKGSFRTLANWDIDHLVWDFPYRKRGLRPWDGGLLQFSLYN